jgi:S-adenosylmethionine hydrolase
MNLKRPVSPIFLLTDFGNSDHYVGVMKAVMVSRLPAYGLRIIDISHDVPPQNVEAGAYLLESTWPWLPKGCVVCAVVDPGVGSDREAAVFHHEGKTIIGPNNGLMSFLPGDLNGRVLDRPEFWLDMISDTFHGRDVFAPCAAFVAEGNDWQMLGRAAASPAQLATRDESGEINTGRIIHFDHFGNAITSIKLDDIDGYPVSVEVPGRLRCGLMTTYSDVAAGQAVAYWGSSHRLEIAVRNGNARERLGLQLNDIARLEMEGPLA